MDQLQQKHALTLGAVHYNRLGTINTVKEQQWRHYFGKEAKVPDRIVSLHKPYVRPIVRGKEVKPVEFSAKVRAVASAA